MANTDKTTTLKFTVLSRSCIKEINKNLPPLARFFRKKTGIFKSDLKRKRKNVFAVAAKQYLNRLMKNE